MSRQERSGARDLTFSRWHRTLPDFCTCIDLDFLEYCRKCRAPLALIEIASGHHGQIKPTTVLRALATQANIRAYLVLYDLDESAPHGINPNVRVQRIMPNKSELRTMLLGTFGEHIAAIHCAHQCCQTIKE